MEIARPTCTATLWTAFLEEQTNKQTNTTPTAHHHTPPHHHTPQYTTTHHTPPRTTTHHHAPQHTHSTQSAWLSTDIALAPRPQCRSPQMLSDLESQLRMLLNHLRLHTFHHPPFLSPSFLCHEQVAVLMLECWQSQH